MLYISMFMHAERDLFVWHDTDWVLVLRELTAVLLVRELEVWNHCLTDLFISYCS
jgi:hypothetical protein